MDRVLAVLIGFPLAFLILKYRGAIKGFIGNVDFAERYLGAGGTNIFIVILGFATFVLSLMYSMGTIQGFMIDNFGSLF